MGKKSRIKLPIVRDDISVHGYKSSSSDPSSSDDEKPLLAKRTEANTNSQDSSLISDRFRKFLSNKNSAERYNERYRRRLDSSDDSHLPDSTYRGKFNLERPVAPGEERIFQEAAKKSNLQGSHDIVSGFRVVTACDIGCGDGRSIWLWKKLAKEMALAGNKNEAAITLRVISYDISEEGIKSYIQELTKPSKAGDPKFLEVTKKVLKEAYDEDQSPFPQVESHGVFKYQNLEIQLLCGDPEITPENFGKAINHYKASPVRMSLILYGSLSHISSEEERNNFLAETLDFTKGCLAQTVPGPLYFREELAAANIGLYNGLGMHKKDVFYVPSETPESTPLFFAIYDCDRLQKQMSEISEEHQIQISTLANPSTISTRPELFGTIDDLASRALSYFPSMASSAVGYWGVVSQGKRNSEQDTQEPEESRQSICDRLLQIPAATIAGIRTFSRLSNDKKGEKSKN
ncbi:MAG: hypothetical protein KA100_06460 [Rickettsiales bacterium]|nr:hypothetical protein [Rickettsiales bacterium]